MSNIENLKQRYIKASKDESLHIEKIHNLEGAYNNEVNNRVVSKQGMKFLKQIENTYEIKSKKYTRERIIAEKLLRQALFEECVK